MPSLLPYLTLSNAAYLSTAITLGSIPFVKNPNTSLEIGGVVAIAGVVAAVAATGFKTTFSAANPIVGTAACFFAAIIISKCWDSGKSKIRQTLASFSVLALSFTLSNVIFSIGKLVVTELNKFKLAGFALGRNAAILGEAQNC